MFSLNPPLLLEELLLEVIKGLSHANFRRLALANKAYQKFAQFDLVVEQEFEYCYE